MTIRIQQLGPVTRWICDTYSEIATVTTDAVIGDVLFVVSPGIELARASVLTTDGVSKTRWVPVDPMWGSNNITMTPPVGVVTDEGIWTISANYALVDAELNISYECLALIIATAGGNVTLSASPTNRPSCLQIKCVSLQRTGGNTAKIAMDGTGLIGASGGDIGDGDNAVGIREHALHGQFSVLSGGGGGGGGSTAGGRPAGAGGMGQGCILSTQFGGQYWTGQPSVGGIGGVAPNGNGNPGVLGTIPTQPFNFTYPGGHCPVGGGGGAGGSGDVETSIAGGPGGGVLFVDATEIPATITLSSTGTAGTSAATDAGGGGGGGGGLVRVRHRTKIGVVTTTVTGGAGGAGAGAAGDGGAGSAGLAITGQL